MRAKFGARLHLMVSRLRPVRATLMESVISAGWRRSQVGSQRITIEELRRLWQAREPVTILDIAEQRTLEGETTKAKMLFGCRPIM